MRGKTLIFENLNFSGACSLETIGKLENVYKKCCREFNELLFTNRTFFPKAHRFLYISVKPKN